MGHASARGRPPRRPAPARPGFRASRVAARGPRTSRLPGLAPPGSRPRPRRLPVAAFVPLSGPAPHLLPLPRPSLFPLPRPSLFPRSRTLSSRARLPRGPTSVPPVPGPRSARAPLHEKGGGRAEPRGDRLARRRPRRAPPARVGRSPGGTRRARGRFRDRCVAGRRLAAAAGVTSSTYRHAFRAAAARARWRGSAGAVGVAAGGPPRRWRGAGSPNGPTRSPERVNSPFVNACTHGGRSEEGKRVGKEGRRRGSRIPPRKSGVVGTFRALGGDGSYIKRSCPAPICLSLHPLDRANPLTCGNRAQVSPEVIIPPRAVRKPGHMCAREVASGGVDHKRRRVSRVADHREAGIGCGAVRLVNCLTYSRSSSSGRGEERVGSGPGGPGRHSGGPGGPVYAVSAD